MSSFQGLSVALSALQAHRRAMDVTGQNVANAGTAGYTRQRAELRALGPAAVYSLQGSVERVGSGVTVSDVLRLSDEFAASRWRTAESDAGYLSTRAATLHDIEDTFAEPSDNGLSAELSELWGAFSDLGDAPDSAATRGALLQQAQTVVDRIGSGMQAVAGQWRSQRSQTASLASQVNALAVSVADLNGSIRAAVASGAPANELADQRDALVVELARMTGATARTGADGTIDVMISGTALVRGSHASSVTLTGATVIGDAATSPVGLTWPDGSAVVATGGELAGQLEALRDTLPTTARGLDDVARRLASTVNALHGGGRTPDGSTAGDFFSVDATSTGVVAAAADRRSASAEVSRTTASSAWVSATGVDVDEEMTNLIAFQRAYEGAARVLTAVDEALDVLINRTGVVGR